MNELEIIIPAYNSQETIIRTLDSIKIQKNLPAYHVTVVNDYGKDYKEIINNYKETININEIMTPQNVGPGAARQYGIDNTSSRYIIFIDSDDCFYDENSISNLYNLIKRANADLALSKFIYERDNETKIITHDITWLHGKIYSRDFLEKNNIKFNNSRANEDNGFNRLIAFLKPVTVLSKDITYIYKENANSITRRNNREYKLTGLEGFAYNINWAIEEGEKRNCEEKDLAIGTLDSLLVMYENYNRLKDNNEVEKIIDWSKNLFNKYLKYEKTIKGFEKERLEKVQPDKVHISFEQFKNKIKVKNCKKIV